MTNQEESEVKLKVSSQNLKNKEHLVPTIVINLADKVLNTREPSHIKERYLDQLEAIQEFCGLVISKHKTDIFIKHK